jgi:hypothetical protein
MKTADTAAMRKKSRMYLLLTAVLILMSFLSVWFVSRIFGGGELTLSFGFITPGTAASMVAVVLVFYLFDSLRFYYVLRTLGLNVGFLYIVKLTFINVFVTAITPLATGGGFAQVYFLMQKKVPFGSAMAASTIRTLLGVAFFLIAVPIVLLTDPSLLDRIGEFHAVIVIITAVIFTSIIAFVVWIVVSERNLKRAVYRLTRFLRGKRVLSPRWARKLCLGAFSEVKHFNRGMRQFARGSKKYLALSLITTACYLITMLSIPVFLTRAMGYDVSPVFIYQAMTVIIFAMYFAFTPGASGVAELGFAAMFEHAASEKGIEVLTLMWRALSVYAGAVIGMAIFYIEVFAKRGKK